MLKLLAQTSAIGLITMLLFELCFRIYFIDFYAGTFDVLNDEMENREGKPTLMVIGDSFSAFQDGYVKVLHDSLSQYRVRNVSVPGTSITEQYLFGRHHIKREQPDVVVFQFYVGNDFLGWRHQLDWKKLPLARNIYWRVSEVVWSLGYLNHELSKIMAESRKAYFTEFIESPFSPDLYSFRDKYYFKSEPGLVENTAYLKGGRERDFEAYAERIQDLFDHASDDTQIFFLMIPHCSQVNERYYNITRQLGAVFSDDFESGTMKYPLMNRFENFFKDDPRVRLLNPIDFLKTQEEKGIRTYFNNDSHLSFEGQRLMGEYLLQNVKQDADAGQ